MSSISVSIVERVGVEFVEAASLFPDLKTPSFGPQAETSEQSRKAAIAKPAPLLRLSTSLLLIVKVIIVDVGVLLFRGVSFLLVENFLFLRRFFTLVR